MSRGKYRQYRGLSVIRIPELSAQFWTNYSQVFPTATIIRVHYYWGTRWHIWLRHCAPSRKVGGSIPDVVTRIFHSHNLSGRTVADSNTNEYQEYFLGCKGSRCVVLTTLTFSCADCLEIWEPRTPVTLRATYRDCCTFFYNHKCKSINKNNAWKLCSNARASP